MKPTLPKGHPKLLHAWAFYDWANSVYSLTIVSAIFPIFYGALFAIRGSSHIEFLGWELKSTALVSFVTALAFLVVAIGSPLLSGLLTIWEIKSDSCSFTVHWVPYLVLDYIGSL